MLNVERFEKISYYKNVIDNPDSLIKLIEDSDLNSTKETSIPKWEDWSASGDIPYTFGYQKRFTKEITKEDSKEKNDLKELEKDSSVIGDKNFDQFENKKSTYDFQNYTSSFDPNQVTKQQKIIAEKVEKELIQNPISQLLSKVEV